MTTAASIELTLKDISATGSKNSMCSTELLEAPWDVDAHPGYGPGASISDPIPARSPRQGEIPREYRDASADELNERIIAAKAAQNHPEAEAIVFCGVHFMAETADLLSTPDQAVILPNLAAGCSMTDMANIDQVEDCWEQLGKVLGTEPDAAGKVPVVPVTYMNSSAAIKGFCGRSGGIVCTSSNAAVEPAPPAGQQHGRGAERGQGHPVAGLLLRAQALHPRPDRQGPGRAPGCPRHRPPRMPTEDRDRGR